MGCDAVESVEISTDESDAVETAAVDIETSHDSATVEHTDSEAVIIPGSDTATQFTGDTDGLKSLSDVEKKTLMALTGWRCPQVIESNCDDELYVPGRFAHTETVAASPNTVVDVTASMELLLIADATNEFVEPVLMYYSHTTNAYVAHRMAF